MPYTGNKALTGLVPVKNPAGTAPAVHYYDVAAAYASAIGQGCLLIRAATGVELAGDAAALTAGIVVGVAATNLGAAPGAGAKIAVFDDPNQEFSVIGDEVLTDTVSLIAMVGRFAGLTDTTNVYSSTAERGTTTLDTSTITGTWTTSLPLQILGALDGIGDSAASASFPLRVKIGTPHHFLASQASGADNRP